MSICLDSEDCHGRYGIETGSFAKCLVFRRIDDGECIVGNQTIILFFIGFYPGVVIRIIWVESLSESSRTWLSEVSHQDMGGSTPNNTWCFRPAGD